MSVPEQTPYIEHIANGVTTSFALEFECKDKEHLIVLVDNVEPNVGTWSLANGSVVFGTAPADGKIITIQRNTPFRRDTNFQSYDNSLRPATINNDFDWVWYKLQELGVANWILKQYVDRKDDELKAYLLEEIRKQGVALDQLDEYYDYLMGRLAQIAIDKGWDASFVVDASGKTQQEVNDEQDEKNIEFSDKFLRLKTYADFGHSYPQMLGYNNDAFADFAAVSKDDALFLNGCLNLVKDLFGVSNNAAALSILGNNSDNFRAQIVSGNSQTISNYGMSEDVLVYAGITGRASTSTNNPTYTTNSLTVTDSTSLSGLKVGSVILTSDGYWSLVSAISLNTIMVDGWHKSGVSGTPTGTTAYLNHVDKTYLENKVLWIPSTYTGTRAVGAEWDFMIANPNVTEKNGLDMVLHDASTEDMDTAFVVRSAKNGKTWLTGFTAKGAGYAAFLATDGVSNRTPTLGSYADVSTAEVSQYLNGGNTYAKKCRFSPSSTVYPTVENGYGFSIKGGDVTKNAISGVAIDLSARSWNVFNNSVFSLVLPATELVDGQTINLLLFGTAQVNIGCVDPSVLVNDLSGYGFTPSAKYKKITAVFLGGKWHVFS